MYTSTVTTKGQATIPFPIRKKLGIKSGQKVVFEEKNNQITIKPLPNFLDLMGSLKTDKKYDKKAIKKALEEMFIERHLRKSGKINRR